MKTRELNAFNRFRGILSKQWKGVGAGRFRGRRWLEVVIRLKKRFMRLRVNPIQLVFVSYSSIGGSFSHRSSNVKLNVNVSPPVLRITPIQHMTLSLMLFRDARYRSSTQVERHFHLYDVISPVTLEKPLPKSKLVPAPGRVYQRWRVISHVTKIYSGDRLTIPRKPSTLLVKSARLQWPDGHQGSHKIEPGKRGAERRPTLIQPIGQGSARSRFIVSKNTSEVLTRPVVMLSTLCQQARLTERLGTHAQSLYVVPNTSPSASDAAKAGRRPGPALGKGLPIENLTPVNAALGRPAVSFRKELFTSKLSQIIHVTRALPTVRQTLTQKKSDNVIEETLYKRIRTQVEEKIEHHLTIDSKYTRRLTDRIYAQLYNRIIMERERLTGAA